MRGEEGGCLGAQNGNRDRNLIPRTEILCRDCGTKALTSFPSWPTQGSCSRADPRCGAKSMWNGPFNRTNCAVWDRADIHVVLHGRRERSPVAGARRREYV